MGRLVHYSKSGIAVVLDSQTWVLARQTLKKPTARRLILPIAGSESRLPAIVGVYAYAVVRVSQVDFGKKLE